MTWRDCVIFFIAFGAAAYVFGARRDADVAVCEIRVCVDATQKEERVVRLCNKTRRLTISCRTADEAQKLTRELFSVFSDPRIPAYFIYQTSAASGAQSFSLQESESK